MIFETQESKSGELNCRQFVVDGQRMQFTELCRKGFTPETLDPVSYVDLAWDEA